MSLSEMAGPIQPLQLLTQIMARDYDWASKVPVERLTNFASIAWGLQVLMI